jgi:hypothetical protein
VQVYQYPPASEHRVHRISRKQSLSLGPSLKNAAALIWIRGRVFIQISCRCAGVGPHRDSGKYRANQHIEARQNMRKSVPKSRPRGIRAG